MNAARNQARIALLKRRRVGRKVISASRMYVTIEKALIPINKTRVLGYRPTKVHKIILVAMSAIILAGYGGYLVYRNYSLQWQETQAKAQQEADAESAKARAVCQKAQAQKNAALFGKVTYDALYGNGICDQNQ